MRAVLDIILLVLQIYIWLLIAAAVLSWLIAFNVVNTRNQVVAMVADFLYRITEPVLRPIRSLLPNLGGIDVSPVILILIILFLENVIIRYIYPKRVLTDGEPSMVAHGGWRHVHGAADAERRPRRHRRDRRTRRRAAVLTARVRALPADGEANAALIRLIAKAVGVPSRDVTLVAGATARLKRLAISGDGPTVIAALEKIAHAALRLVRAEAGGRTMTARIIDGKTISADLRGKVTDAVHRLRRDRGIVPGLAVVLIGENPASEVYVRNKSKAVAEAGMQAFDRKLPATASEAELIDLIAALNSDEQVNGILVQLPLPKQIDAQQNYRGHRSGQGRGWFPPDQCRAPRQRLARPCSVHADGMRAASQDRAFIAGRPRSRGDRPLQHCRQAGCAIAARRKCDGDDCPFQDERS